MTLNSPEILRERGKILEDEFFRREDQRLIRRMKELKAAEVMEEDLAKALGITKPAVLKELIELGIRAETVTALFVVPLVEVAWADGKLDARERRAVVKRGGVSPNSTAGALVDAWLDHRPDPKLLTAWVHLAQGICEQVGPEKTAHLKTALLERATAVAEASGGLVGLGSKISPPEAAMLANLEAAFAPSR